MKPRWPYILGGIGALVFAGALGFFMTDAADDITEDLVGYVNAPEEVEEPQASRSE